MIYEEMHMNIVLVVFAVILFFSIYGAANYYIGLRGWQGLGNYIPFINSKIYWVIFFIIATSYIVAMLLPSFIPARLADVFHIIGGYWMVVMLYMILLLPIIDIVRLLNRRFSFLPDSIANHEKTSFIVAVAVLVLMTAILAYGTWNARSIKIIQYDLDIKKNVNKFESLKVIIVSDVHLGNIMNNDRLSKMIDRINTLEPDVVLLAGDIIDNKLAPFIEQDMHSNFLRLKSKYGVYACLGNHESITGQIDEVVEEYTKAGIKVLRDNILLVEDSFYIVGREDFSSERITRVKRKALSDVLVNIDKSKPIILMDHQPKDLNEPEAEGVDIQVSGHTHRGQVGPANIITSRLFEIDYGYLKKGNMHAIVSSGFGTWGPPVRIGSRSEIVQINLSFK